MSESTSNSEKLRREAEELRQTAQRLIEEAARANGTNHLESGL